MLGKGSSTEFQLWAVLLLGALKNIPFSTVTLLWAHTPKLLAPTRKYTSFITQGPPWKCDEMQSVGRSPVKWKQVLYHLNVSMPVYSIC